jgi:hypothetical protein
MRRLAFADLLMFPGSGLTAEFILGPAEGRTRGRRLEGLRFLNKAHGPGPTQ